MSAPGARLRVAYADGSERELEAGTTALEALRAGPVTPPPAPLAAALDGTPIDLARPLERGGRLLGLRFADRAGREILQHSAAHLLAKAVLEVEPAALPTVGPPTDEGFYYDFDMRPITPEDLPKIEAAMARAVAERLPFERFEVERAEALRLVAGNRHKVEYVRAAGDGPISFYRTGPFVDLCRGPHVPDTSWLAGVALLGFSGVRSGEPGQEVTYQRVRGIGFPTAEERSAFLKLRKEAEARDHRVIGARLELFHFSDEAPGMPFWHPNGMIVIRELERYVLEHLADAGYSEIRTPLLFAQTVFERSGHWEHYREHMFRTAIDERPYALKPMNCPGAMLIFGVRDRSYRELPLRLAEFAPLHRLEASGTIHGLTRVREFVQDDAHVFVTEEQIVPEIRTLMAWIRDAFTTFRLSWSYELSTRPESFLGAAADWDRAQGYLESVLKESGVDYRISPGEGAFYGPKIDIHIRDSLGRPWQTGTIQLDFQQPRRFGLKYQGADGQLHDPAVIHRVILGTWERFLGVFLEHCNGRLPPWLAPEQLRLLPVSEAQAEAARAAAEEARLRGIRASATGSSESLGKRIREAELARIPYVGVIGEVETAAGTVALRRRGSKGSESFARAALFDEIRARVARREYDA